MLQEIILFGGIILTTLYEHQVLGNKISIANATFNMPFLMGKGIICLYEHGITLIDSDGNEKYMIEFDGFETKYESFINMKSMKCLDNVNFNIASNSKYRGVKDIFKRVKGNFYGKFTIMIPDLGDIEFLDNHTFKYRDIYRKINSLKKGINPLENHEEKRSLFSKLFNRKLF